VVAEDDAGSVMFLNRYPRASASSVEQVRGWRVEGGKAEGRTNRLKCCSLVLA